LLFLASFTDSTHMFQNNQYARFLSGYIVFTITLFEAAGILESRFDTTIDTVWILCPVVVVFLLRLGTWIYAAASSPSPKQKATQPKPPASWSKALNLVLGVAFLGLLGFYLVSEDGAEVLLEDVLPEMEDALLRDDVFTVYSHASEWLSETGNPLFESYLDKVTSRGDLFTNRDGVELFFRFYNDTTKTWFPLGPSPNLGVRLPYSYLQIKFVEGEEEYTTWTHPYYIFEGSNKFILPPKGTQASGDEMLLKIGAKSRLSFPGLDHLDHVEYSPFEIARMEVTNEEFFEFVRDGGYLNENWWLGANQDPNETVSHVEMIAQMKDATGSTGPANWEYGRPPRGQEQFPVTGVSWHEARAYASYKGMSLPTVHQWASAASLGSASRFVPKSNFSKNQMQNVGDSLTINPQGLFDIAGNVREWAHNQAGGGDRAVLGGCFLDDDYSFNDYYSQPAMNRSIGNGIRLVRNLDSGPRYKASMDPVFVAQRDFRSLPGISEDVFEIYRARFGDYNKTLDAQTKRVPVASAGPVVVERAELADIDGDSGEILPAYVFFDSTQKAPYKPVIFFPGSGAIHMTNTEIMLKDRVEDWDYLLANGYAVIHPVYTSTYEKEDHLKSDYPVATRDYTEHVLSWGREYKKVIDYIVTRTDMDAEKLSYYGVSWGGYMANILLAIDDRVRAAVLNVAGFCFQPSEPSVESYIYTPRVSCPVIMLNGKYDVFFPLETSQNPMFELLGTPDKDKKHYVYPSGHYVPRDRLIEEHLGWLQKHLEN